MHRRKPFTGRHMLLIMVAFFGVVIAVNVTMATLASQSFGGTVVDNSYVASQRYNRWLAEARAQGRLGWDTPVRLDTARRVTVGVPGLSFAATGTAHHPLGRQADVPLSFRHDGDGQLVSTTALPAGRWQVRIAVRQGDAIKRLADTLG